MAEVNIYETDFKNEKYKIVEGLIYQAFYHKFLNSTNELQLHLPLTFHSTG